VTGGFFGHREVNAMQSVALYRRSRNPEFILTAVVTGFLSLSTVSPIADAHSSSNSTHHEAESTSQTATDHTSPDDEHRLIDVTPTLAEEAELLRRVETERLGINPRTETASTTRLTPVANTRLTARIATRAFDSTTDPAQVGRWEPLQDWPVVPVFTSLLADGRVLTFDSVGDDPVESFDDHSFTRASIWDPVRNIHARLDSDTGFNLFCSGFASLEDGRLFIAGGNADRDLNGIVETHTFNPLSNTWARGQRMDHARWYPAVTPLADGEMLITGGGFPISEVRETDGTIRKLSGASSSLWNNRQYPWLQTAPDGRVAFLGPAAQLGYVDTVDSGAFQASVERAGASLNYGSYAMYDIGKVLVSGGGYQRNGTDQRSTHLIDLTTDTLTLAAPMNNRRRQHNLTVLADGSVLATGGHASDLNHVDLANSVYEAELWQPDTGMWQSLAEEDRARQYHSSALLLPDGRVLSGGGGLCGNCQLAGYLQKNAQVFSPPYLFARDGSGSLAARPGIASAPAAISYDRVFAITSAQAASIRKVSLVRTGSVTHSQNMEQRFIPLSFSISGNALSVLGPENANIAPPGHYLLFIVDEDGVPSVADIIRVRESLDDPQPVTSAINIATSGSATQSSTRSGAQAMRAIDGNTDGNAAGRSLALTITSGQPWWEIDLGQVQAIRQIVINGRSDCCDDRLADFHVLVSDAAFDSTTLSDTLAQPGVSDHYVPGSAAETRIDVSRSGRFVRVQLAGISALEIAEVQVLINSDIQAGSCGSPGVDPQVDGGLHLWKACDGPWTLMLSGTPGAGTVSSAGTVTSALGFADRSARSLEPSDTLTTLNSRRSDFDMTTANPWTDHFEFTTLAGDAICIGIDPRGTTRQLFIGPDRVPAGTGPINPDTLQSCVLDGASCVAPAFDPRIDRGLAAWIDCEGVLHMIASGALENARYSGRVHVGSRFSSTATRSFEPSDTLISLNDSAVYFDMRMGGGYADEILLTPASDAELCIEITAQPSDSSLWAGSDRSQVSSSFDPRTFAPCTPPTGDTECGNPTVNTRDDSAFFIWRNCDDTWSVAMTGISTAGGAVKVQGRIESSQVFDSITPKSLEGSDSLLQLGDELTFDMTTQNPWSDGFEFKVPSDASLCVTLTDISDGLDMVAGPDRTPVGISFNPETYAACS